MPSIKMKRYTLQQRITIVKIYYKNGENFAETVRKVKSFLGRRKAPFWSAIVKVVQNAPMYEYVMENFITENILEMFLK